jgi:hypothetical protein
MTLVTYQIRAHLPHKDRHESQLADRVYERLDNWRKRLGDKKSIGFHAHVKTRRDNEI